MNETIAKRRYDLEWLLFGIIVGTMAVLHGLGSAMATM